ncbi:MAG: sigma-70 family RNA polymerase sigma factor [Spirochaetes bacterium]|nr:sigma-70 family RNA polymerase sigma factor [Spirochaetota bacterium]
MKKNNRKIFRKLYEQYYTYVLAAIYSRVNNQLTAEDICQEVFVRFYDNLDKIEEGKHGGWLKTALKFEISNYLNKKSQKADDLTENESDLEQITAVKPQDAELKMILEEAVENEKNFESDTEKIIFNLIAIYGYSYHEAGRELGLSKRQIGYKYNQIAKRIMEDLRHRGIGNIGDLL